MIIQVFRTPDRHHALSGESALDDLVDVCELACTDDSVDLRDRLQKIVNISLTETPRYDQSG